MGSGGKRVYSRNRTRSAQFTSVLTGLSCKGGNNYSCKDEPGRSHTIRDGEVISSEREKNSGEGGND